MRRIESETHKRALALIARGQADQDTLLACLTPEERAVRGEQYAWSPKDHVAHNNFWRQDAIARLKAALEGTSPVDTEANVQSHNDRVFWEQRETPLETLVAETARLRDETAEFVYRFSAEDLTERDRYPWQQGGSLQTLILINWYDHPAEHWTDVYLSRQEIDRALELRRAVANTVGELFRPDSKMFSFMVYKLGGVAARTGRSEQAIAAIREAIAANPSLVEFARKDPELDPLRSLPWFRMLTG